LQGVVDFVRNLVLEEIRKDSNTRKTSRVDEPSALAPAAPTDRPAIVDQMTRTDAEKKDRRDRLEDKYRKETSKAAGAAIAAEILPPEHETQPYDKNFPSCFFPRGGPRAVF
jgi:hypothetical protein